MMYAQFEKLLGDVNSLFVRYQKINEITGEEFNIFKILQLEASEVRMHSAFLAELLNPNASHGQKDIFLKLFIEKFCYRGTTFDTTNCEVVVEKYIGLVSYEDVEGGRIDISIRDKNNNYIIIENKIYAPDQAGQLMRYHKHASHADLFYLTLEGSLPTKASVLNLKEKEDFKCISYRDNIIEWLEACRKEVAILPIIREAISHYINLIKYLTNQTLNQNMEQELTSIMRDNLKAAFAISGNLNNTLQKVSDDFGKEVETAITAMGLKVNYNFNFGKNYTGIWIWREDWKYMTIGFQFQSKNHNMIYGYTIQSEDGEKPKVVPEQLLLKMTALPNNEKKENGWWPWFNHMENPYGDWNRYEACDAIFNGNMLKIILEKTKMLLKMTEDSSL